MDYRDRKTIIDAANIIRGSQIHEPENLRHQSFQADGGGGNILDYTPTDGDNLILVNIRLTTSVPIILNIFVDNVIIDRLHLIPGPALYLPSPEIIDLSQAVIEMAPAPIGVRFIFNVSDGPCTMRLWWKNGPVQFP